MGQRMMVASDCGMRAPIRSLLYFVVSFLAIGFAGNAAQASDFLPARIDAVDVARFADVLALDGKQRAELELLFDRYKRGFDGALRDAVVSFNQTLAKVFTLPQREQLKALKDAFRERDRLMRQIAAVDAQFFDQVDSLLQEDQRGMLQRVRMMRERATLGVTSYVQTRHGFGVDLTDVLTTCDLGTDITVLETVIAQYEIQRTALQRVLYRASKDVYIDLSKALTDAGVTTEALGNPETAMQARALQEEVVIDVMDDAWDAMQRIRTFNERSIDLFCSLLLDEDSARRLRRGYFAAEYPDLRSAIDELSRYEDLEKDLREAQAGAVDQYEELVQPHTERMWRLIRILADDIDEIWSSQAPRRQQPAIAEVLSARSGEITVIRERLEVALSMLEDSGVTINLDETGRTKVAGQNRIAHIMERGALRLDVFRQRGPEYLDLLDSAGLDPDATKAAFQQYSDRFTEVRQDFASLIAHADYGSRDRARRDALHQLVALEESLFDALEELAQTPDQIDAVSERRHRRRRERLQPALNEVIVGLFVSRELTTDLSTVMRDFERAFDDKEVAESLLADYDNALLDALRKRMELVLAFDAAKDQLANDAEQRGYSTITFTMRRQWLQSPSEELLLASRVIVNLNRQTLRELRAVVNEGSAELIQRAYEREAYPHIFVDPTSMHDSLKRAELELGGLGEVVRDWSQEYERQYLALSRAMIVVLDPVAHIDEGTEAFIDDWGAWQSRHDKLNDLIVRRTELNLQVRDKLLWIMTKEQLVKIGPLPDPRAALVLVFHP